MSAHIKYKRKKILPLDGIVPRELELRPKEKEKYTYPVKQMQRIKLVLFREYFSLSLICGSKFGRALHPYTLNLTPY